MYTLFIHALYIIITRYNKYYIYYYSLIFDAVYDTHRVGLLLNHKYFFIRKMYNILLCSFIFIV
jgi:hypothetical protein